MSKPEKIVVEVNRRKFLQKHGSLNKIYPFLIYNCKMDISRPIECMKDPANKDVVVFWQSLPNEFLCDVEGRVY
jgi:hypothetical protein